MLTTRSSKGPVRPPGRPRTPGLDEKILGATLDELARVGYARMNLDSVASLAGTTKPTLYSRYPSKASLATAALESMRRATPRELTGETRADLIVELTLYRKGALRPHGMSVLGAVLAEEHETPELLALFREHVVLPRRENLRQILRAGKKSGELRVDADIELGIAMLIGSLSALYIAGRPVSANWPVRVVDAWLGENLA